jgi:hypothetical protein
MAEAPWTITRLELLYYSRLHKRWQIWQESAKPDDGTDSQMSAPGELHRSQIFSLLRTVRASLVEVSKTSGFKVDTSRRKIKDFVIVQGGLRDVLADSLKFWQGYLQYIGATSRNYGIKAEGGLDIFLSQERLKKLEPGPITITGEVALDLISMLPILRHWDLQGCWFRAVSEPRQERDSFVPKARNGSSWAYPFYMASIRDSPAEAHCDGPVLTESPLSVELMYEDLGAFDSRSRRWNPQYQRPKDFFECCHRPKSGDELLLYQCYSFLFDKLRKMLNPEGDFFVAYPVQVLGRLNFLHIWVRRDGGGQLKELWDFWFNSSNTRNPSARDSPHTGFWSRTRDFLSFNLRGIAHSTFQAAWQTAMAAPPEKGVPRPKPLGYSLCECAHLLMPLDWIKWRDLTPKDGGDSESHHEALWRYQRYNCGQNKISIEGVEEPWGDSSSPPASGDRSSGSLGMRWKREEPDFNPPRRRLQVIGTLQTKEYEIEYAIRPSSSPTRSRSIPKGAVRLAIEQQLALGEMFRNQEERKQAAVREWIMCKLKPYCSVPANLASYRADGIDSLVLECQTDDATDTILRSELKARFGQSPSLKVLAKYLGAETVDMLMKQRLPFHMSLYLEIGPLKALTHPGPPYWNERELPLATALTALTAPVYPMNLNDWSKDMALIQAKLVEGGDLIKKVSDNSWYSKDNHSVFEDFSDIHHRSRCESKIDDHGPFTRQILGGRALSTAILCQPFHHFRPCFPIIEQLGTQFAEAVIKYVAINSTCTLVKGAILSSPVEKLSGMGFSHTVPLLSKNVFALRYVPAVKSVLPTIVKARPLVSLGTLFEDYGRIVVGMAQDGTPVVQVVGERTQKTIPEMFGSDIESLSCENGEMFVAIVVDTVRLEN